MELLKSSEQKVKSNLSDMNMVNMNENTTQIFHSSIVETEM